MSNQAANLNHAQAGILGAESPVNNQSIYTFTSGLHGTGLVFTFGLFALAQSRTGAKQDVDAALRDTARRLLREVYLPMLPWESTERPNPLDELTDAMAIDLKEIGAAVVAVVIGQYIYLGWHGDGRAFLLTDKGVEPFVSEDNTQITSHQIAKGNHLLLCASSACPELSLDEAHQIISQAPTLQAACDELVGMMPAQEDERTPLVLLVHYPD